MSNITDIKKLNFYSWTNDGMDENPNGIPSEDVFVLRSDVIAALQNEVSDPLPVIPDWIIKYDQANYQSSAGKAIRFLMEYASIVNERRDSMIEKSRIEGILTGLKICKEMWAQGTISHENIYENEVYYKEELKNIQ